MSADLKRVSPVTRRLNALSQLDKAALLALEQVYQRARAISADDELFSEGKPVGDAQLIISGWAARIRMLPDGRKQILGLLLPGDLIGHCYQPLPIALTTVVAISDLSVCRAPSSEANASLQRAYAISHALDESYLFAQITRLGRMKANERLADFFLELLERLALAGLDVGDKIYHPLTQEMVADVTGLTAVHVNRTLKAMRRDGQANWDHGYIGLPDKTGLEDQIMRAVTRVTAHRNRAA